MNASPQRSTSILKKQDSENNVSDDKSKIMKQENNNDVQLNENNNNNNDKNNDNKLEVVEVGTNTEAEKKHNMKKFANQSTSTYSRNVENNKDLKGDKIQEHESDEKIEFEAVNNNNNEFEILKRKCESLEKRGLIWKEQQRALRLALRDLPKQIYDSKDSSDSEEGSEMEENNSSSDVSYRGDKNCCEEYSSNDSYYNFDWRNSLRKLLGKLTKLQQKADNSKADAESLRASSRLLLTMKHSQEVALSKINDELINCQRELVVLKNAESERDEYLCRWKSCECELEKREMEVFCFFYDGFYYH